MNIYRMTAEHRSWLREVGKTVDSLAQRLLDESWDVQVAFEDYARSRPVSASGNGIVECRIYTGDQDRCSTCGGLVQDHAGAVRQYLMTAEEAKERFPFLWGDDTSHDDHELRAENRP